MPGGAVRQQPTVLRRTDSPTSWTYESLRQAAAGYGVSAEALLRRLVTLGLTTPEFYEAKRSEFLAAYANEEHQSRGDGGNFYATTARDLGKSYVREIADAHRRRVIDSATAATYLGVKVGQIPRLREGRDHSGCVLMLGQMAPLYSFDTSVIISGRRDLLRPTTFQTLWTNIETMVASGAIRAIDEVKHELAKKDDDASQWAKAQPGFFLPIQQDVQQAVLDILRAHPKLMGKGNRRNAADPFVIALAMVHNGTVVTQERGVSLSKPHIPDVCNALQVPCLSLVDFVQEQGWIF